MPNNLTLSGISDQVAVIIIIFISKEKDLIKKYITGHSNCLKQVNDKTKTNIIIIAH